MKKSTKIAGISLLVVSALYSGAWKYYSVQFRQHIEERLAEVHSRGFEVTFDYARVSGYPFGFDVNVKNLNVQRKGEFRTWVDGITTFSAKIWKPQEISATTDGPHYIQADEFQSKGNGLIVKSFVFDPMRMNLTYEDLAIVQENLPFMAAKQLEIDVDLTPVDNSNTATTRLRAFAWNVEALKNHPLGSRFENIEIHTALKGFLHGDTLKHMARNWFEEDGVLDINELSLKWGQVSVSGNGSIVLDDALQPMAAFSLKIMELNEGIDAFKAAGKIEKKTADMLKIAAGLLRQTDCHKVSLSIQNNRLYIASIPVMKVPVIKW